MRIGHRCPDPVQLGGGVAARHIDPGEPVPVLPFEPVQHLPPRRPDRVLRQVDLVSLLAADGGDQDRVATREPIEQDRGEPVGGEEPLQIIQPHHHPRDVQVQVDHEIPQRLTRLRDQQRGVREPLPHHVRGQPSLTGHRVPHQQHRPTRAEGLPNLLLDVPLDVGHRHHSGMHPQLGRLRLPHQRQPVRMSGHGDRPPRQCPRPGVPLLDPVPHLRQQRRRRQPDQRGPGPYRPHPYLRYPAQHGKQHRSGQRPPRSLPTPATETGPPTPGHRHPPPRHRRLAPAHYTTTAKARQRGWSRPSTPRSRPARPTRSSTGCAWTAVSPLPAVDLADEAVVENADVLGGIRRHGDGVLATVTMWRALARSDARHSDGRRRAWPGPERVAGQQISGASNRPWAKKPINAHGGSASPRRSR